MISKLAIGTAQFGLDYGISNPNGQISFDEVKLILTLANEAGLEVLDTAVAYGNSHEIVGKATSELGCKFKVVSKLPHLRNSSVTRILDDSLSLLKTDQLFGFLLHSYEDFEKDPTLLDEINLAKKNGRVKKTGFSLYGPDEAKKLLDRGADFDLVQIPYSVFDRRFEAIIPDLREYGIEIHTRSVFLQGLLFKLPDELPTFFEPIKERLSRLQRIFAQNSIPLECGLLNFALLNKSIDKTVIGVDSSANLKSNLQCVDYFEATRAIWDELDSFGTVNLDMILPTRWPQP